MPEQSSFDRLLNFRDVGKTVDERLGSRYGKEETEPVQSVQKDQTYERSYLVQGLLFRSARPGARSF